VQITPRQTSRPALPPRATDEFVVVRSDNLPGGAGGYNTRPPPGGDYTVMRAKSRDRWAGAELPAGRPPAFPDRLAIVYLHTCRAAPAVAWRRMDSAPDPTGAPHRQPSTEKDQ